MKYDFVEIVPIYKKGTWQVRCGEDDTERVKSKACPNSQMGFYHYPRCEGLPKAFKKLKEAMIERHKTELARLAHSLDELEKVELPLY